MLWRLSEKWGVPVWKLEDLPLNLLDEADTYFTECLDESLDPARLICAFIQNWSGKSDHGIKPADIARFNFDDDEPRQTVEEAQLALEMTLGFMADKHR